MPSKRSNAGGRWSLYPSHHDNVSRLLRKENLHFNFHVLDDPSSCIEDYDTNIMGRFICNNNACPSSGWSSKMIAITIRMYPGERYNARVYHQRCRRCNRLSRPIIDESYAERVAYRLKKWRGIQMEVPHYSGKSQGPHDSDLCEGCKAGHCSGWS
ncbi:zinc-binding domain-containing protein [Aspergillus leporis]|uniref:Zinc-binding domain-containing protein n=1 Tax=Aspergillus leporis TaxID=41062 RepID=A0A5N5WT08_9EURO|nr:zinc-binding domain-containing protein [Aspergillus leporis]